ncbi:MAG: hypothetical protein ACYTFK_14445 [Planctomycetota bacterium]|jgi:hypothetical protein
MKRPEYDDDANIGDDTMGCPGIMDYLSELESYADQLEREKRAVLVYQAGLANVFEVDSFNLSDYGREARRIMQSDFYTCEVFARGLAHAGYRVGSASCNMAGDIINQKWTHGTADCPFRDITQPVWRGVAEDA